MGEEKSDFKFIAGAHISLIKISTKGLDLLHDIIVSYGMCSFSPDTAMGLVLTGHILNKLLWYLSIFRV